MNQTKQMVNLLMNIVMGLVLGITGQVLKGTISALPFIQNFVLSMGVGYLIGTYIPIMDAGTALAHKIGLKKGLGEYLLSTLVVAVCMVVLITFFCLFVQSGSAVFSVFIQMIVPFLAVGIIAIELSLYWIKKFAIQFYSH